MKIKYLLLSLLALAVVLSSTAIAFGEDSVEGISGSPDLDKVQLYEIASQIKASTNSTMDLDDIYIILNDVRKVDPNGNIVWQVYDNVVDNDLNVLDTYSGSHMTVAQILYRSLLGSRWDTGTGQIGLLEGLNTIWSTNHADQLAQMTKQQAIINALSVLDTNERSDMLNLISALNTFKTSNHTDITSFQNDFNNITWTNNPLTNTVVIYRNGEQIVNNSNYQPGTFTIPMQLTTVPTFPSIFRFHVPLRMISYTNDASSLSVSLSNQYSDFKGLYSVFPAGQFIDIYWVNGSSFFYNPQGFELKIVSSTSLQSRVISSFSVDILDTSDADFYPVYNYIIQSHIDNDLHHQNTILDRFKDLYASDDLVAAKQAQQDYEDQAVSDFTGSGSAAAKGSDLIGAKQISGSLKNGLSTGVSVSDGLGLFNSGSFWSWFSQSNSDQINNLYVPSRSDSKSNNEYYDHQLYDQNISEVFSHMQGDKK